MPAPAAEASGPGTKPKKLRQKRGALKRSRYSFVEKSQALHVWDGSGRGRATPGRASPRNRNPYGTLFAWAKPDVRKEITRCATEELRHLRKAKAFPHKAPPRLKEFGVRALRRFRKLRRFSGRLTTRIALILARRLHARMVKKEGDIVLSKKAVRAKATHLTPTYSHCRRH